MERKKKELEEIKKVPARQLGFDPTGNCIYEVEPPTSKPNCLEGILESLDTNNIEPIASP